MSLISHLLAVASLLVGLASPSPAVAAVGTSFGGVVSSITPCKGGVQVSIIPAGLFQPFYVWSVGSIGPVPFRIGQYILGVGDIATLGVGGCIGQRIQYDGVGL
jgi:hypothetical protein